ncbi:Uncharacterized protein dnm_031900 [Desulfonema magnum]|uniref:Uncharacterized protein n=1 Tax=Desulfonema magnum TaxID=45655 RepID=A0A975GMP9_9BACT|nr:Uncharacterized protein dnm_031900 [Desulfonema magnum]
MESCLFLISWPGQAKENFLTDKKKQKNQEIGIEKFITG